ncbi:hypothetical protein LP419_10930 [Massilia sp. H-1]|nr:hypothetical protein LP419_10930 [Massilia sp. H-1]
MDGWTRTGWRWIGMLCCLLAACGKQAPDAPYAPTLVAPAHLARLPEYTFGVTPMSNFRDIYDTFQPIVDYLNASLPDARLVLEVPRGLAEHEQQLEARNFAFCPVQSLPQLARDPAQRLPHLRQDGGRRRLPRHLGGAQGQRHHAPGRPQGQEGLLSAQVRTGRHHDDPAPAQAGRDRSRARPAGQLCGLAARLDHGGLHERRRRQAPPGRWPGPPSCASIRTKPGSSTCASPPHPWSTRASSRDDVPPDLVRRVGRLLAEMHDTAQGRALLAMVPVTRFRAGRGRRIRRRAGLPRTTQAGLPGRTGCASLTG